MSATNSVLSKLLHALAEEMARLDYRMQQLVDEQNTLTTDELLENHERDFDLPNANELLAETEAERRSVINTKYKLIGKQNANYFKQLAEDLGHQILIFEHHDDYFLCGVHGCGDGIGDQKIAFVWSVAIYWNYSNADTTTGTYPLLKELIYYFYKYKPAHTFILWDFYGPGFTNGFSSGFNAMPPEATKATWEGGFVYDGFSAGFDRYHGVTWPAYRGGGFTRGFKYHSFNLYKGLDLTYKLVGGYSRGFSSGFNFNLHV